MSFPESTWELQPLRTVHIQNTDFSKLLSSPEAFQLQTNSKVLRACYILLLGEKLRSEIKSSALSSHLIPSRTGTVKSLVCLRGSAPQGYISWPYVSQTQQTAHPLDHSGGCQEKCTQIPDTYTAHFSEQDHPAPGYPEVSHWQYK